jgi:ankyrin repeat protein
LSRPARSRAPEQVDSPAIAAGFAFAALEHAKNETLSSCSDTLIEQRSTLDPGNMTTRISALGLYDINTDSDRDRTAAKEEQPGQTVTNAISESAPNKPILSPVELNTGSTQASTVRCEECKVAIGLFQVFYRCLSSGLEDPKHHGFKVFAVCVACHPATKFCREHAKLLVRSELVRMGDTPACRLYVNPKEEPEDSILIKALKGRNIARLEILSSVPGLVNASDANKHTPLHVACHLGLKAEVLCLLGNGADLEARDFQGRTPLFIAVLAGNFALVPMLIENGANKSALDGWGCTPLHLACHAGLLMSVTTLLTATPADQLGTYVNRLSGTALTPLLYACESGEVAMVTKLLEAGADPNLPRGVTFVRGLRLPQSAAGLKILKLLVSYGADLFARDATGWNYLHANAWNGRADLCRELFRINLDGPTVDKTQGTITVPLSPLGPSKLDPNAKTFVGFTALYLATMNGHIDTVRCLLEFGADTTIKCRLPVKGLVDTESCSPLAVASCFGHADIVTCLIRSGASPHETSPDLTPLYIAAQLGRLEICRRLIQAGAAMNFMKQNEESILSIAARNGNTDVVEMLLELGARAWPPSTYISNKYKTLLFESGVPYESRQRIVSLLRRNLGRDF